MEARNEVKWEIYIKKVQIEARVLGDLSLNHIIPVAVRYQSLLLDNIAKLKETFGGYPEYDEYIGRAPTPGSQDCRTYLFRHSHGGRNGGSPQKKQTVSRICVPKRSLTMIPSLPIWTKSVATSTTWS